jgi:hypothetical protein
MRLPNTIFIDSARVAEELVAAAGTLSYNASMSRMAGHEPLRSNRRVTLGSDRNFGLVFAGVFAVIALWPALRHGAPVRWWGLGICAIFLSVAVLAPRLLAPLNIVWFKFGLALHAFVSPLIMGLLFYGAVLPVSLALRLAGRDILRLRRSDEASYWIRREPPGPPQNSMGQQF